MKRIRENHKEWARHKKELRRRRKNKRKASFVPRIVVDTNIWYDLGDNEALFLELKEKLAPTYVPLWELCHTGVLKNNPLRVRNACRRILEAQKNMIYEQPIKYLIKSCNKKKFKPNTIREIYSLLEASSRIARGAIIAKDKEDEFYQYILATKQGLKDIKVSMDELASVCKSKIKNNQKHKERYSLHIIIDYLNYLAKQATNNRYNLRRLPLRNYELLICVMDLFYKKLETGETVWGRNDLNDLFILAYVRKGDKYWTKDQKWIDLIKEAGCEEYLFNPDVK
ncbi:hypothetical protein [Bacteroides fragilis]|uniref:hypothetical protein n=1 Tax=Bacteroides fragilis TaxID=817 RepID=UPI00044FFBC7|nr:hypothetical protein [Bacteroides fragilis]EXY63051.1 hypothetical protein M085_4555 [Bacteroides fragilis str. 3986 N(B)19]EYA48514.1 hypothetical protein M115_2167 [Bacteroides fragilis str. 3719 T6]